MRGAPRPDLRMFDLDSGETSGVLRARPAPAPPGDRPARGSRRPAALPTLVRPTDDPWPEPVGDAAFIGLAGEIVGALAPATEADPTAILVQLLVGFGSLIGRGPHYRVGASRHRANELVVLVGPSGSGRKGSSWDIVESVLVELDETFVTGRVVAGLSSGEGLIWHVRDGQHGEGPTRACSCWSLSSPRR